MDELVQDAVKQGAKINAGGKRNDKLPNGLFYEPTVLSNVTHEMRVVNEVTYFEIWKETSRLKKKPFHPIISFSHK